MIRTLGTPNDLLELAAVMETHGELDVAERLFERAVHEERLAAHNELAIRRQARG